MTSREVPLIREEAWKLKRQLRNEVSSQIQASGHQG